MPELTTKERMTRMFEHREADRVPVFDGPWASTLERWRREGMPEGVRHSDYFDLDKIAFIFPDNSPLYPARVIEETDEYSVSFSKWGATSRNWKHAGGVPEFLDFTIKDADSWAKAKERMQPTSDRIDWDALKRDYAKWRENGTWISGLCWFGFDVTHSWAVGTERTLMAMACEPEWIIDMLNHELDVSLALLDQVWDAGYHFDEFHWLDDMGYKNKPFFSPNMYREILKPVHKRGCEWAQAKGIRVRLHSCGDVRMLIPDLMEIGVEMLNPVEVKAGMDPIDLKKQYGDRLAFHGGINAVLYEKPEEMWEEMRRVVPVMKENGGYVLSSDHSVPDVVSLEQFREFVRLAKELGSYE